jgi:competence protein ComGC
MDAIVNAATKRKRKLTALSLLVVLFVISYLLLTKLVIEQDKTIDSQRSLIHMLFKDNAYLGTLRKHAGESSRKSKTRGNSQPQAGIAASQSSASENPSSHVSSLAEIPLTQIPVIQVPSSKVGPQANAKTNRKARKAEKTLPAPPVELTDPSDMRRVSFAI